MNGNDTDPETDLSFGEAVYDGDGNRLGTIRGLDEHGFYVTAEADGAAITADHLSSGRAGEAELMWRCWECGEVGDIEAIPDGCPSCGAPKEDIYYWIED